MQVKRYVQFLFFIGVLVFSSCSNNLLKDFGSKTNDDSLLFDAQAAVNAQRYDEAIAIITQQLSATGQTKTNAREILASAYAGKCGLNFLNYVDALSNSTSTAAFQMMSSPFVGMVVHPPSCLSSLQTLDLIGTPAQRTSSQNIFAAVVGMVLLGSATRLYTDDNPVNGDGTQDSLNVSCQMTNAQIDYVVLGYSYLAQNFTYLSGSQISSGAQSEIGDSINICQTIAGAGTCTNTDPTQISGLMRDTMKDLLNTQEYGVGTANGTDPLLIPVACP
jgi:hypothetical protein